MRYVEPAKKTLQYFADNLIAKLCKVANAWEERTMIDVFIEGVDASIRHSLPKY